MIRKKVLLSFLIIVLLATNWFVDYGTNGTSQISLHLFYLPIIISGFIFGSIGGLVTGIISGIMVGPFMQLEMSEGIQQTDVNWLIRLMFFVTVGIVIGFLASKLKKQAYYNQISRLPNRNFVNHMLSSFIKRDGKKHAFLILNLDNLKNINESFGYSAGDHLINEIPLRIRKSLPETKCFIIHWRNHEFVIWLIDINGDKEVLQLVAGLKNGFKDAFMVDRREMLVNTSIGISLFPQHGRNFDALVHHAKTALQEAKKQGKNKYMFYEKALDQKILHQIKMEVQLGQAIKKEEFEVYYQPMVEIKTGKIIGAEALIRWNHPEKGVISPSEFISIAEETGQIVTIGYWVLQTACKQNKAWQDLGINPIVISVNLSLKQLQKEDCVSVISNMLQETGLSPKYLELELTESNIIDGTHENIQKIRNLKEIGLRISLDDFGTGYSSLSYLKIFPIDTLKIDSSFIKDIATENVEEKICKAIITMAHSMNLKVVAEGVEDIQQMEILKINGCDVIQGYYFSRPVPAKELDKMLKEGFKNTFSQNTTEIYISDKR